MATEYRFETRVSEGKHPSNSIIGPVYATSPEDALDWYFEQEAHGKLVQVRAVPVTPQGSNWVEYSPKKWKEV